MVSYLGVWGTHRHSEAVFWPWTAAAVPALLLSPQSSMQGLRLVATSPAQLSCAISSDLLSCCSSVCLVGRFLQPQQQHRTFFASPAGLVLRAQAHQHMEATAPTQHQHKPRILIWSAAPHTHHANTGAEFEARILASEANNVKFNFLQPTDPYHAYYRMRVRGRSC
jgi:hypothetical protein